MDLLPYNGTWITCGSYALLNIAGLNPRHLIAVENSAGATFGMASLGAEWDYTRLLTPVRDFTCGVERCASFWGLHLEREETESLQDVLEKPIQKDIKGYLIGPINMVKLVYLPVAQQYTNSDHFIAVRKTEQEKYCLIDSEGVIFLIDDIYRFCSMISGKGIPESEGRLNIWAVRMISDPCDPKTLISHTIETASANFRYALETGQGPGAFLKCNEVIGNTDESHWRISLGFDFDYLIQRRLMMKELIGAMKKLNRKCSYNELEMTLDKQIECAGFARYGLQYRDYGLLSDQLILLSEEEKILSECWEAWTAL